jgi:assimilatory nitrate reductase catalytic subunit
VTYKVPEDKRAQLVYFRAGNPIDELVYILFKRNSKPMRYFPIGARPATHVELAVVEDLEPGTILDVLVGAPDALTASLVLDIGLVEIAA